MWVVCKWTHADGSSRVRHMPATGGARTLFTAMANYVAEGTTMEILDVWHKDDVPVGFRSRRCEMWRDHIGENDDG